MDDDCKNTLRPRFIFQAQIEKIKESTGVTQASAKGPDARKPTFDAVNQPNMNERVVSTHLQSTPPAAS
jgi:hypothetical protein